MKSYLRVGAVVLLGVTAVAIVVTLRASSSSADQPAGGSGEVAARLGARTISIQELDARWRARSPAEFAPALQAVYDGRLSALEGIVADATIAEAARAHGMSPDQFEATEVPSRTQAVGDRDVEAFYESNRDRLEDQAFADLRDPIRQLLERRAAERARQSLVAELRQSSSPLRIMMEAPRLPMTISPADPFTGPTRAPVTIVEFADFQCPFCARIESTFTRLRETSGDAVRIVWKDYPLMSVHPHAFAAAEASYCAGEQHKFWEYHDRLFANQEALEPEDLKDYAIDIGLDVPRFTDCVESSKYVARIEANLDAGKRLGVEATPTLFVNGRMINGSQPYETFAAIIDDELQRAHAPR